MVSSDIEDAHQAACAAKRMFYKDPETGLQVFTAVHLITRPCCGCGCRHCPYHGQNDQPPSSSSMLNGSLDDVAADVDVLFWSGGKDSFLALRRLQRQSVRPVILLTTYDSLTKRVAHQGVHIDDIINQALRLRLPLLGVPVGGADYTHIVSKALNRVRDHGIDILRVAFGDLHLAHVRHWRDSHLTVFGASLYYPLWTVPYPDLLDDLTQSSAVVTVSAVDEVAIAAGVHIGDKFDKAFIARLPKHIDPFGENGEFHTLVHIPT